MTPNWRAFLLRHLGPGILGGITFGDWMRTLRDHRFAIAPSRWPRALSITAQSLQNSALRRHEDRRYGPELDGLEVESPIFILGHWRNGTTHLHNLLCVDHRFAFPNTYEVCFPHIFLSTEGRRSRLVGFFLPKHRPMDQVEWSMTSPQEDEFALCILSQISPCMSWIFPRHLNRHDKHLTLRDIDRGDLEKWQAAFELFLKKLTWKHRRPLVLKSPPHTARLRLLLGMFPRARFIHIHRDPYTVFQSSKRTFEVNCRWQGLQRVRPDDLESWVLKQYKTMYDAFFEDRGLIPQGQYCEVRFEDLEKEPIAQVRRIYERLGLPDFAVVEARLATYHASLTGYRKNTFPEIPRELRSRIAQEWSRGFEEWGYPT